MTARLVFIVLIGTLLVPTYSDAQQPAAPAWDMLTAKPEVVQAWRDQRFGMFVCWGPVTLSVPKASRDPIDTIIRLELDGPARDIPIIKPMQFYRGTTIGENRTLVFDPLTGQRVRLNVVKAAEGPSIWEFQLFGAEK